MGLYGPASSRIRTWVPRTYRVPLTAGLPTLALLLWMISKPDNTDQAKEQPCSTPPQVRQHHNLIRADTGRENRHKETGGLEPCPLPAHSNSLRVTSGRVITWAAWWRITFQAWRAVGVSARLRHLQPLVIEPVANFLSPLQGGRRKLELNTPVDIVTAGYRHTLKAGDLVPHPIP